MIKVQSHLEKRRRGKAISLAIFWGFIAVLVAGFIVLTYSQFIPLVYFGILVSLAMIGGLAGNLILLPLMISLIEPNPGQQSALASATEPNEHT